MDAGLAVTRLNLGGLRHDAGLVCICDGVTLDSEDCAILRDFVRRGVELDVRLEPGHRRSDEDIATAVEVALKWHALVPAERVRAQVEKGWVTLTGEVDWEYQRAAALKAVRPITGVVGVTNSLNLKPQVAPADVADRIRDALARHAEREARHVEVMVKGATVTLRGQVDSWPERAAAEGASWSAPGITRVVNELTVSR